MRPTRRRRGVTLLEMLVTVGLLVLIMTILVAIFSSATGAITGQRMSAAIDQDLRRVESLLRRDLKGVTAKMTPPNDAKDNRGYFTYGEQAHADLQDEDTDDYIAFTAKAPTDQPFTGTVVVPIPREDPADPIFYHRVTVTSDTAEVIYFLRNGNLYRRVFLILPPEWQSRLTVGTTPAGLLASGGHYETGTVLPDRADKTGLYDQPISWLGLNDVSARPSDFAPASDTNDPTFTTPLAATRTYVPRLNTLGDLTHREYRAFNPRHAVDFLNQSGPPPARDGVADELNGDDIPDFYTTLYPQVFTSGLVNLAVPAAAFRTPSLMAFPYVYPNGFSQPDFATQAVGLIHSLDPALDSADPDNNPTEYAIMGARIYNHAPLDIGDNLPYPGQYPVTSNTRQRTQTWWAFPTKKETLSQFWTDPVKRLNDPVGAYYFTASAGGPDTVLTQALCLRRATAAFPDPALPPMTAAYRGLAGEQPFNDGAGSTSFGSALPVWQALPEDDLIMSGVRSFDVKALEVRHYTPDPTIVPALPELPPRQVYVDLGHGNYLDGLPLDPVSGQRTSFVASDIPNYFWNVAQTFAHEGRIPPVVEDLVGDPKFRELTGNFRNIGQNGADIVRLRRVYDTWSTAYSRTPSSFDAATGSAQGHFALPSYPAPYDVPLSGIQIQIRATDPNNMKMKSLTIRHDFSNQL